MLALFMNGEITYLSQVVNFNAWHRCAALLFCFIRKPFLHIILTLSEKSILDAITEVAKRTTPVTDEELP